MKKFLFMTAIAAMLFSCDKDPDNTPGNQPKGDPLTLTGQVTFEEGEDYSNIATIKAMILAADGENLSEMATTPWNATGSFSITLPALNDNQLTGIGEEMPAGIVVSDMNTKGNSAILMLYGDNGDDLGMLSYAYGYEDFDGESMSMDMEMIETSYLYVDRDVTITGNAPIEVEGVEDATMQYNCVLKRGWNTLYAHISMSMIMDGYEPIITATATTTTTKPNRDFIWEGLLGDFFEVGENPMINASKKISPISLF